MKVAVYAIMKNEAQHISGWLDSTTDADVRILCDTGSSDGSPFHLRLLDRQKPIVETYGISVQPFRFDTARNVAMSLIPPDVDWCISLDLDERLDPGWRGALERAVAAQPDATRVWVNYDTPLMAPFQHDCRVHSRHGWRWADPCHECIRPSGGKDIQVASKSFWIRHHPDRTKSRGNYLPLLALGIFEEPWNTRRIFYLARELVMDFQLEKAAGWFRKYLELWKEQGQGEWMEVEHARALLQLCDGALQEMKDGKEIPEEVKAFIDSRRYGPRHTAASTPA